MVGVCGRRVNYNYNIGMVGVVGVCGRRVNYNI